ncbi:hypothetical protein [Actinomadura verrucosospora]
MAQIRVSKAWWTPAAVRAPWRVISTIGLSTTATSGRLSVG